MKTTYDEAEGYAAGDPSIDYDNLEELQEHFNYVEDIVNPITKAEAVKQLVDDLNG